MKMISSKLPSGIFSMAASAASKYNELAKRMQLENLVAIELLRRHRKGGTDGVYYYQKGVEVDFYVPDAALAIQVCHSLHDHSTRERELRALGLLHLT
jgi:predicted AAA+ superfamily ATPase